MNRYENLLLVINADSKNDAAIIKKAERYSKQFSLNLFILYVIPELQQSYYQLPPFGISYHHPMIADHNNRQLEAKKTVERIAKNLGISEKQCFIKEGALTIEAKHLAQKIDAHWILGCRESIIDTFKNSKLYRIISQAMKYIATLIVGYNPHRKTKHTNIPIFLK